MFGLTSIFLLVICADDAGRGSGRRRRGLEDVSLVRMPPSLSGLPLVRVNNP